MARRRGGRAVGVFPLMVRGARRAFQTRNLDYENAARSLGSPEWRVFWQVALPLAYEPILAAAALAFARVLTEFSAVVLIAYQLAGGIYAFPHGAGDGHLRHRPGRRCTRPIAWSTKGRCTHDPHSHRTADGMVFRSTWISKPDPASPRFSGRRAPARR